MKRLQRILVSVLVGCGILAVGLALALYLHVGPTGAPTSLTLPTAAAAAQAQDGMTPISQMTAPGFTLTDQRGRAVSLSAFRGRAVVLTFLDPVCWYQCPLQAQDMKLMLRYLPASARANVALVSVVTNPVVHSVAAVQAFDRAENLTTLPNWYFLTSSSVPALRHVWSRYFVDVSVPREGMVDHSQAFYLIAPDGQVKYLSEPSDVPSTFVGTAQLLAAYVARILNVTPTFPAGTTFSDAHLPTFVSATPAEARATVGTTMEGGGQGWKVAWQHGYEVLDATHDGGKTWVNVSPAGVTKKGGLLAAFGRSGQAWVVVLPWGYTLTPLSFYTGDYGATWTYTGVWPGGSVAGAVTRPLAASGSTAYWLTRSGLWAEQGSGAWRKLAATPTALPGAATVTADASGGVTVAGHGGTVRWTPAGGWQPAGQGA